MIIAFQLILLFLMFICSLGVFGANDKNMGKVAHLTAISIASIGAFIVSVL